VQQDHYDVDRVDLSSPHQGHGFLELKTLLNDRWNQGWRLVGSSSSGTGWMPAWSGSLVLIWERREE
jgi:hypothetical protein